jgi:hypothetical protein
MVASRRGADRSVDGDVGCALPVRMHGSLNERPTQVRAGLVALSMGAVGESVRPFACHRLVEALDLAVGARSVGLGGEVADAALVKQFA